jgi:hypothetical protein
VKVRITNISEIKETKNSVSFRVEAVPLNGKGQISFSSRIEGAKFSDLEIGIGTVFEIWENEHGQMVVAWDV